MHKLPVSFHFKVEFSPSSPDSDIRFQEVGGLTAEITTEELREGGLNEYAHRLPVGAKYGNLVLKRGFIHNSEVTKWCRQAIEHFVFSRKDVTVHLLNEEHNSLASWIFTNAYPVKWSLSDLKAQENALAIETLELAYSKFRRGEK